MGCPRTKTQPFLFGLVSGSFSYPLLGLALRQVCNPQLIHPSATLEACSCRKVLVFHSWYSKLPGLPSGLRLSQALFPKNGHSCWERATRKWRSRQSATRKSKGCGSKLDVQIRPVKIRPPGIGPQILVLGSTTQRILIRTLSLTKLFKVQ